MELTWIIHNLKASPRSRNLLSHSNVKDWTFIEFCSVIKSGVYALLLLAEAAEKSTKFLMIVLVSSFQSRVQIIPRMT